MSDTNPLFALLFLAWGGIASVSWSFGLNGGPWLMLQAAIFVALMFLWPIASMQSRLRVKEN